MLLTILNMPLTDAEIERIPHKTRSPDIPPDADFIINTLSDFDNGTKSEPITPDGNYEIETYTENPSIPYTGQMTYPYAIAYDRYVVGTSYDGAHDVHINDIDDDGNPDIVTDAYIDEYTSWWENPSDPVNNSWTQRNINTSTTDVHDTDVGDIDGDTDNDTISTERSSNKIVWYRNPADPTSVPWDYKVIDLGEANIPRPRSLDLGDIDGANGIDVAVAGNDAQVIGYNAVVFYLAPTDPYTGTWSRHVLDDGGITAMRGYTVTIADIDDDDNPDIIWAGTENNISKTWIYFAPNDPTELGSWTKIVLATNYLALNHGIVDFDDDTYPDIITAHNIAGWGNWSWFKNPGGVNARTPSNWYNYTISPKLYYRPIYNSMYADFDLDGDKDLVLGTTSLPDSSNNTLSIFYQPDDPTAFWDEQEIENGTTYISWLHDIYAGDIDNDGRSDVVVASASGDSITWWKNVPNPNQAENGTISLANIYGDNFNYADSDGITWKWRSDNIAGDDAGLRNADISVTNNSAMYLKAENDGSRGYYTLNQPLQVRGIFDVRVNIKLAETSPGAWHLLHSYADSEYISMIGRTGSVIRSWMRNNGVNSNDDYTTTDRNFSVRIVRDASNTIYGYYDVTGGNTWTLLGTETGFTSADMYISLRSVSGTTINEIGATTFDNFHVAYGNYTPATPYRTVGNWTSDAIPNNGNLSQLSISYYGSSATYDLTINIIDSTTTGILWTGSSITSGISITYTSADFGFITGNIKIGINLTGDGNGTVSVYEVYGYIQPISDESVDADSNDDSVNNIGIADYTYLKAQILDGVNQNITENDTAENFDNDAIDDNTGNVDGSGDKGTHSNFENEKAKDTTYDTLTEADQGGGLTTDELDVSAFDLTWDAWDTEYGSTPYIDNEDDTESHNSGSWIHEEKSAGALEGWFTFDNTAETGTGWDVVMSFRCDADDTDDGFNIYVDWTGSGAGSLETTLTITSTSYAYYYYDFPSTHSATEINNLRIYLERVNGGAGDDTWVDRINVSISKIASDYELDLEVKFTGANYTQANEYLCIYAGTQGTEALTVEVWDGSWNQVISDLVADSWNNVSVSSYLTSATLNLRFLDSDQANDGTETTWDIDYVILHTYNVTNFRLQWEHKCWDLQSGSYEYAICIYGNVSDNSETVKIQLWNGSDWNTELTMTIGNTLQWYNETIPSNDYVIDDNLTWRYVGNTESSDTVQNTLILDWAGYNYTQLGYPHVEFVIKNDANVTRDGVWGSEPFRYSTNILPAGTDILSTDWFYGSGNTTYTFNFSVLFGDLINQPIGLWLTQGGNTSIEKLSCASESWRIYVYTIQNINNKVAGKESGVASDQYGNITINGLSAYEDYWFKVEIDVAEGVLLESVNPYRGDIYKYATGV